MDIEIPTAFKRRLAAKPVEMQRAVLECLDRLSADPRYPSLQTHRIQGTKVVWEAYVDQSNRVTFHYEHGRIVMRNHCNHDIIEAAARQG